jgi:hypothetical protein
MNLMAKGWGDETSLEVPESRPPVEWSQRAVHADLKKNYCFIRAHTLLTCQLPSRGLVLGILLKQRRWSPSREKLPRLWIRHVQP